MVVDFDEVVSVELDVGGLEVEKVCVGRAVCDCEEVGSGEDLEHSGF
jgi:hypothetical protein